MEIKLYLLARPSLGLKPQLLLDELTFPAQKQENFFVKEYCNYSSNLTKTEIQF